MKKLFIKVMLLLIIVAYTISVPIYGQASNLKEQGSIKGFGDEIRSMKDDFFFLESEIINLMEECK